MLTHIACIDASCCSQVWGICHELSCSNSIACRAPGIHGQGICHCASWLWSALGAHVSLQHLLSDTCLQASESVKPKESSRALRMPAAWLALQQVQAWNSWQTGSRLALLGRLYGWDRGQPTCTHVVQ